MILRYKSLRAQKAGNEFSECEDWSCPPDSDAREFSLEIDPACCKANFAIADGATEGMLSGKWAELVVKAFCRHGTDDFAAIMSRARTSWQGWRAAYLQRRAKRNPIKWYEEPGLEKGAFSTLLGISFLCPSYEVSRWVGMAVGDSCVFQIRDSKLAKSFPITDPESFSNSPFLINSNTPTNSDPALFYGDYREGDEFYLATDALSCWFLKNASTGAMPWVELAKYKEPESHAAFDAWINGLRNEKLIKNDDVTLAMITVDS
jgi:hypothetical protein